MEIINYKKRDIIPLNQEENNLSNEQEMCYICEEKFCVDKLCLLYILIEQRLKIIVIIQENLEDLPIVFSI